MHLKKFKLYFMKYTLKLQNIFFHELLHYEIIFDALINWYFLNNKIICAYTFNFLNTKL